MVSVFLMFPISFIGAKQSPSDFNPTFEIDKLVNNYISKGNIPGLTVILIDGGIQSIKNYGVSNLNSNVVNGDYFYELGDNSMAFTALAILRLENENLISLDACISEYLPSFQMYHKGSPKRITVRQLLHHTSGIPSNVQFKVEAELKNKKNTDILNLITKNKLTSTPASEFDYSEANYTILVSIIEAVTGKPYKEALKNLVFQPLKLEGIKFGGEIYDSGIIGHKIGFLSTKPYSTTYFSDNHSLFQLAAKPEEIADWIHFNLGTKPSVLKDLIEITHLRDESVDLHDNMLSYGMGWKVSLNGNKSIFKTGRTPNFSSFIMLDKGKGIGIAVLCNVNSPYTEVIGNSLAKLLSGRHIEKNVKVDNSNKFYIFFTILLIIYNVVVIGYLIWVAVRYYQKKRFYSGVDLRTLKYWILTFLLLLPFLTGIYLIPDFLGYGDWEVLSKWYPGSFNWLIYFLLTGIALSYLTYCITLCFPEHNKYYRKIPQILLMSIISGLSDVVIISMITSSFSSNFEHSYQLFYYLLALGVYLIGRRQVQFHLINISLGLVYDLRIRLTEKIFKTPFQNFERIDKGRVYSTMDQDIGVIGNAAGMFTGLFISSIAIGGTFIYLATLEIKTTLILFAVILILTLIYYYVSKKTDTYYEEARDERGRFMGLLDGLIHGFKEIDLHEKCKENYKTDIETSAARLREKVTFADLNFLNAQLLGESMLLLLLGIIVFGLPIFKNDLNFYMIASFVIVLLYILSPLQNLLNSGPELMRFKVSWKRISGFIDDIPEAGPVVKKSDLMVNEVFSFKAEELYFSYPKSNGTQENFQIGPISLEAKKGEIIFITGSNGSGKSTLAKLLIGLYKPQKGSILINQIEQENEFLGEYFSAVFNPPYIFRKLYGIDSLQFENDKIYDLLNVLGLEGKVSVSGNEYSTIDLSSGQRKRLALLQCYLEDSPLLLFDEWASDQDPTYRSYFYKTLLPQMKSKGKIIIAITHDDNYFHVADQVLEMREGELVEKMQKI